MLTLASGASSVVVAPEFGGGLTGWVLGRTPILRRAGPQASTTGDRHGMGCIPLLPYCNRIRGAGFRWRGTDHRLEHNFGDNPATIHGLGWQRPWAVTEAGPLAVLLTLDHQADAAWPFAFGASIRYMLSGTVLTVAIGLTSRHDGPAPAGIGLHPYFPKGRDPMLRFDAAGVWENGPDCLPVRHGEVPVGWQHREPRRVAQSRLDNCFTGWGGSAEIDAGPASLRIEASAVFRHLQVFTPSWGDFFCVEPVSHVPDAVNHPDVAVDQAMHVLGPNETLSGTVRLCPGGAVSRHGTADAPG